MVFDYVLNDRVICRDGKGLTSLFWLASLWDHILLVWLMREALLTVLCHTCQYRLLLNSSLLFTVFGADTLFGHWVVALTAHVLLVLEIIVMLGDEGLVDKDLRLICGLREYDWRVWGRSGGQLVAFGVRGTSNHLFWVSLIVFTAELLNLVMRSHQVLLEQFWSASIVKRV